MPGTVANLLYVFFEGKKSTLEVGAIIPFYR